MLDRGFNPVENVTSFGVFLLETNQRWGVLENDWSGELLNPKLGME